MRRNTLTALVSVSFALTAPSGNAFADGSGDRDWVMYAEAANGNLHFYDRASVETIDTVRRVWNGLQYKTSLMGAFSFLSLVDIDCAERTEKTLQSTFFTDKNWERPAMATDRAVKPETTIAAGSPTEALANTVCD